MQQDNLTPELTPIGDLKTLVRENGKNSDDGDGWSVLVDDARKPPIHLPLGFFSVVSAFLFGR